VLSMFGMRFDVATSANGYTACFSWQIVCWRNDYRSIRAVLYLSDFLPVGELVLNNVFGMKCLCRIILDHCAVTLPSLNLESADLHLQIMQHI